MVTLEEILADIAAIKAAEATYNAASELFSTYDNAVNVATEARDAATLVMNDALSVRSAAVDELAQDAFEFVPPEE